MIRDSLGPQSDFRMTPLIISEYSSKESGDRGFVLRDEHTMVAPPYHDTRVELSL